MAAVAVVPPCAFDVSGLAQEINREHRLVGQSIASALAHATRAGELLHEAKASLPPGAWLPWIAANFDDSPRTAQLYMRISKYRDEIPQDVSLAQAQRALTALPRTDSDEWAGRSTKRGKKTLAGARARRKNREGRLALEREQRARAARKRGGTIATGYSHMRRALQDLERAAAEADPTLRRHIEIVVHRLYMAEDGMKEVLGVAHGRKS
jgi:hypothetical protein